MQRPESYKKWSAGTSGSTSIDNTIAIRNQEASSMENYRGTNPFQKTPVPEPRKTIRDDYVRRDYCDAKKKNGEPCRQKALYGRGRCKFHGGLSTGPKTEEGKQQSRINGAKGGRPRRTEIIYTQGLDKGKMPEEVLLQSSTERPRHTSMGDESDSKLAALVRMVNALRQS